MNYGDILWVEDFDDGDSSPLEQKIKNYYTESRTFRVDVQRRVLELLQTLEDEKIFSKYSCAVLDINLNRGFKMIKREFKPTKNLLEKHQIRILDEHEPQNTKTYADFAENAGYYIYLYLIRRGMPAERICMLTGNKGNTTDDWEKLFRNAGLMPPEAFDRETEREKFHAWLDEKLTPPYRLRACIVGMSRCAEEFLSDDETKAVLQNLPRIPLRLSDSTTVADREFISALWQIVQPWESPQKAEQAYRTTLKLTRNWLAHSCLNQINLLATAFLFGIGLRGLLDKKIPADADEFNLWETELLKLLKDLDAPPAVEKEIGELVMKSCQEFFKRVTTSKNKLKIPLSTDLDKLVGEIGQKSNNIQRLDTDLIRNFLHGVYPIHLWCPEGKVYDSPSHRLGIVFEFDKATSDARRGSTEAKYLNAVKNTLARAVDK